MEVISEFEKHRKATLFRVAQSEECPEATMDPAIPLAHTDFAGKEAITTPADDFWRNLRRLFTLLSVDSVFTTKPLMRKHR